MARCLLGLEIPKICRSTKESHFCGQETYSVKQTSKYNSKALNSKQPMKILAGSSAPVGAKDGTVYFDVKQQKFQKLDGSMWCDVPKEEQDGMFLSLFGIEKYTKTDDGKYDIHENVKIIGIWEKLPIPFGTVDGNFDCSRVGLKSMLNMPSVVVGDFAAVSNKFPTIEGMPVTGGKISFNGNKLLKDFRGLPATAESDLDVSNCGVHAHYGLPRLIKGNLSATDNEFRTIPEGMEVLGDADFTQNKIISETHKSVIHGNLWLDENPCTAENDNIKENAIWS